MIKKRNKRNKNSNNTFICDGGLMKKYNKRFMTLKKKSLNYNKTNSKINNKNSKKNYS